MGEKEEGGGESEKEGGREETNLGLDWGRLAELRLAYEGE